jgi:hypothetical protein
MESVSRSSAGLLSWEALHDIDRHALSSSTTA